MAGSLLMAMSIPDEHLTILENVARQWARQYGEEYEDLRSEALLSYFDHENITYRAKAEQADKPVLPYVKWKAVIACRRYCMRQKAEREGFDYSDVKFYKPKELADLLPGFFAWLHDGGLPQGEVYEVRASGPANEGGNALATMCDVSRVYEKASEDDQRILRYADDDHLDWETIGRLLECEPEAAKKRHYRAVVRLTDRLNDFRQKARRKDLLAQRDHEGPGSRRVLSNQEGQALLRQ